MVNFATFTIGTAVLAAQLALGAPGSKRDSAVGDEVAVSAPDGIPITDTEELESQSAAEASTKAANGGYLTDTATAYTAAYTTAAEYDTSSAVWDYTSTAAAYDTSSVVYDTTSTTDAVYETSSDVYETSAAVYDTTSDVYDTTSSVAYDTTSAAYTSVATYGSGSSSWGNSEYNDCVQQCVASFGAPAATYTPPSETSDAGSTGTGATHTIIVAPTQGVLRYVPFATNASVGDTIKFVWNANVHTVTKGSQLELCNITSDAPFTSGVQNQSFVFTQVVNSTDPTFFYCNVPTHCQKGMFGIINPPNADVAFSNSSVAAMMPSIASNDSQVSAWASYTQNATEGSKAATWGNSIDMGSMPEWSYSVMAENVMYTRNFLAANPDVMKEDGSVDLGASSAPLVIPQDLNAVLAASGSSSAAGPSATSSATGSASSASASASPSAASGARGLTASFGLASVIAFGAALFAL
ncbi:hypothetical protein ACEPAF_5079 [Sanghuangporus sanghuang]